MFPFIKKLLSLFTLIAGLPNLALLPDLKTPMDHLFVTINDKVVTISKSIYSTTTTVSNDTKSEEPTTTTSDKESIVILQSLDTPRTTILSYSIKKDNVVYYVVGEESVGVGKVIYKINHNLAPGETRVISHPTIGTRNVYYYYVTDFKGNRIDSYVDYQVIVEEPVDGITEIGPEREDATETIPTTEESIPTTQPNNYDTTPPEIIVPPTL